MSPLAGADALADTINNSNKSNGYFDKQVPLLTAPQAVDSCDNKNKSYQY